MGILAMTISKTLELILERLTKIEDTVSKLPTYEALSTTATRDDVHEAIDEMAYAVETLAEDTRRKERLEWLAGARGAMGKAS